MFQLLSATIAPVLSNILKKFNASLKINIQRAQQRMKDYYDRDAIPTSYDIGENVWVYIPKTKRGLSRKLLFSWHGPYTIVGQTSPVSYVLQAADNRRIATTVHVSRMKPYVDPASRPIRCPPKDIDESFLLESELPTDSFAPDQSTTPTTEALPNNADSGQDHDHLDQASNDPDRPALQDPNVHTVEKIVHQRLYKGKPQFEVKWKGYRQTSWEPLENILDPSLITRYYHNHPRARNIEPHASSTADLVSSDIPVIAAFSPCFRQPPSISPGSTDEPTFPSDQTVTPMLQRPCLFSNTHILSLALLLLMATHPGTICSSQFDPTGKPLTFYPDSLILSSNPQVLAFYKDTTLVTVHVDLHPTCLGAVPVLNNTCSPQQKRFYDQLLLPIRSIQRVIRRFSSLQVINYVIECDSFLCCYYFYLTGKESQLNCKNRHFAKSLQQCRSWAKNSYQTQSPDKCPWLRQRNNREAWACSAGVLGAIRWIWEHTGYSCSDNNISGLIPLFFKMVASMSTTQRLVHTVYGKQVYFIKMADKLPTQVNGLSETLRTVEKTFPTWQSEFQALAKTEKWHHDSSLGFLSKYTMEVNRTLTSLLHLQELDDFVRQAEKITNHELVGFNDLPRSISMELSAQLSAILSLKTTIEALDRGFPLIIRPLLNYDFSMNNKFKITTTFAQYSH